MKSLVLALLLFSSAFADVNFTGTWTGTASITRPDGQTNQSDAILHLKHDGTTVTGTAGPNEDQQIAISNAKANGNKLTFAVKQEDVDISFDLLLDGDHLKGTAGGTQGGATLKITLDVTRAK